MANEYTISLNFFPLLDQDRTFTIFRKKAEEQKNPFEDCKRYNLPEKIGDPYEGYWVSHREKENFTEFKCDFNTNRDLTLNHLFNKIAETTKKTLPKESYELRKKFSDRIYYNIEYFKEGKRQIVVEPYFLKSANKFGILLDFEFKNETEVFNRKIQQLSLSLDEGFRSNTSYYADKYWMLGKFIQSDFKNIFNDKNSLQCISKFENIKSYKLDVKNYIFKNGESNSQYLGIKSHKPLRTIDEEIILYFIYKKGEREHAVKLIDALRGKSYPNIFPGIKELFDFGIGAIKGASLENFSNENILTQIEEIKSIKGKVLPIVLLDDSSKDKENSKNYYRIKYHFINNDFPIQVVTKGLIENQYSFKYSIANIALQVFSKSGGVPWKVKARNEKCLIIGIGKSHRWETKDGKRVIKQYYAYSVLVDSSGIFKSIDILSQSNSEDTYYDELKRGLENTISEHGDKYQKIVLHTPFKIRWKEFQAIKETLTKVKAESNIEFVVLKINTNNKFFGFYKGLNSLVPYESSFVVIGDNEYLVWFEGSQYHNKRIQKRFGGPTHIEVSYSSVDLSLSDRKSYLQDTINLSGANWRGFNSKSLPVSIYYCQIISKFLNEFDSLNLDKINIRNLKPWFI